MVQPAMPTIHSQCAEHSALHFLSMVVPGLRFIPRFLGGTVFFAVFLSGYASIAEAKGMPLHGNWCGPGHPPNQNEMVNSPEKRPLPIDSIDAACKGKHPTNSLPVQTPRLM